MKNVSSTVIAAILCLAAVATAWHFTRDAKPPPALSRQETEARSLLQAAVSGDVAELRRMVAEGYDVNASGKGGDTALMLAAMNGQDAACAFLLDHGAKVNARNGWGVSALLFAGTNNRTKAAALLIARGADLELRDRDGLTPLMYFANIGGVKKDIFALLLKHGADPAAESPGGLTPDLVARYAGDADTPVIRLLEREKEKRLKKNSLKK
jgi:ankyrin repeat protein